MDCKSGYIYVRSHPSYDIKNACKMGKTINIPERDSLYATGEINRGYFEVVFAVPTKQTNILERLLQNKFSKLNVYYDTGTEFYDKKIIGMIEPYLIRLGIKYKKLSIEEVNNLIRCYRIKKNIKKINIKSLINVLKSGAQKNTITPRLDQEIIIDQSVKHFKVNNKGMLILMCGVGKTRISLWITQKLNLNTIVIGVPNKLLLKQWEINICELFQNVPYLVVSSGINIKDIAYFLKTNQKQCIVITTYSSAHKIYTASQDISFMFNMKILDEVHHLTTDNMLLSNTTKKYVQMLNISSVKQLALTATIKQLEGDCENIVSNDNIKYFGEIIDKKSLLWAINQDIICDYAIQTIVADKEDLDTQLLKFNIQEETNKRLFLSAYASLQSIFENKSHHLLVYTNNKNNSQKIMEYIKLLLKKKYFDIPELYYSSYHSKMKSKTQREIIANFEKANFGIIYGFLLKN